MLARFRRRRVPVRLQLTNSECAAACLAMMVGYYDRKVSVSTCRDLIPGGRDGTTARALADAAQAFGLRAKALAVAPGHLAGVRLPAIAHWRSRHFVVVETWSPAAVEIVDPARGRRRLTQTEFAESFSRVVLVVEPSEEFAHVRFPRRARWRHFTPLLKPVRRSLAQLLAASLVLQAGGLVVPLATAAVVDRVLVGSETTLLPFLALAAGVFLASHFVVSLIRERLLVRLQVRLDRTFMTTFTSHLLSLPLGFFESRGSGDLLARLSSNAMIRETLSTKLIAAALDATFLAGYAAILVAVDAPFALAVLLLVAAQAVVYFALTRQVHTIAQSELTARAEAQNYLVQVLAGIATVKASGRETDALTKWQRLFAEELEQTFRLNRLQAVISTTQSLVGLLFPLSLLLFGAWRVSSGAMSLGIMLAATGLAGSLLAPIASLVSNALRLQRVGAYLDRLADVLAATPEQSVQAAARRPHITGAVRLRDVAFRYAPHSPLVLHGIRLDIRAGEKIVIAGRTGSGKSTLAKLLLGLYRPSDGEILYDGKRLDDLDLQALRGQFGVVLQEPVLFDGTIRENIAPDAREVDVRRLEAAAAAALVHDEIAAMPLGYETPVGEGGMALSGGQRQRVALARALMQDPSVLLLGEATSHLDAATEALIDDNLSSLSCTRIVIAHRLSTIRSADRIVVFHEGTVVEEGTHDELVALGGSYSELVEAQTDARPLRLAVAGAER